jgi:ABC-type antimicrobial peptide transport system permease subunit
MTRIFTDLRFGLRMLSKTPSATAMVLIALSLGIGLSAVMFSLIDGAVLTKLPVERGDRIVRIQRADLATQTPDDYVTWSSRQRSLEALGAYEMSMATLSIEGSAAAMELTSITTELDREKHGDAGRESSVRVRSFTDLFSERGRSATLAALMLGVAFIVVLVAFSNVANVLLARAVARRREIAVRLAIGASRLRITAQLLVETSVLAAAGGLGGVLVAVLGTRTIAAAMSQDMPYWIQVRVDWPVLGVMIAAAWLGCWMPARRATRVDPLKALASE